MREPVHIIIWYALLAALMIGALYADGNVMSGTIAAIATVAVCVVAWRRIARLTAENRKLQERMNDVDRLKRGLMSRASHELKAPLASMQETVQLMVSRIPGPLTEKQERLLQLSLHSGRRLARMLGNLLDLSRLEARLVDYSMDVHDAGDLVRRVADDISPRSAEKAVRIVANVAREPLMVFCDPNHIAQVLTGLVENAVQFSPSAGTVRVEAGLADPQNVLISVADEGVGIQDSQKKAIFDGFYPVQQERKILGQSLGLGLAIAHAIVQAHQGTIWVEDNPNAGSIFFVKLPRASGRAAALPKAV
jgi:signal transduction histidine kinase